MWAGAPSSDESVVVTPESRSVAERLTVTSLFTHADGALAEVDGAVRSILMSETVAVDELPARSETLADAERLSPSLVITLSAGHAPSMPERASLHVQWIVTSPWYQPFPFGAVVGAPLMIGAVLSTLIPDSVTLSLLPATSRAVPVADCAAPSPKVCGASQVLMPDSASAHVKLTVTLASYQSLPFGLRSRAALMVGFVWSMFTVAVSLAELPALSKAAPTTVWLAPSLESVVGSLQLAMPESASAQWKLTSTGVLFQLSALAGGACVWLIDGVVLSMRMVAV